MDGAYHLHFDDESSGEAYAMSVRPKQQEKVQRLTIIDSELVVVVVIRETKRNPQPSGPKRYMSYGHETEPFKPDSFDDDGYRSGKQPRACSTAMMRVVEVG